MLFFSKLKSKEDVRAFGDVAAVLESRRILFKDPLIAKERERERGEN